MWKDTEIVQDESDEVTEPITTNEGFWPDRVRVRNFKGNGNLWNDTEIVVQDESDEVTEPTTTNEDNEEIED